MKNRRWSASRIYHASICDRKHFYGYYTPEKKLPSPWVFARGHLFHSLARRFFKRDGKPFRKSVESFVNTAVAEWKRMSNRENIDWQGINAYVLVNNIKKIATTLYETYSQQKPPLATELRVNFTLNGIPFVSIFDEVREKLIIRDHKTSPIPKITRDHDYQPTLYLLGFVAALAQDPRFAELNQIPPEQAAAWLEDPKTLCDQVNFEYHIIRTGDIIPTTRSPEHIEELLEIIFSKKQSVEEAISQGRLPEANRGYHCNSCEYRDACHRDSLEKRVIVPPQTELFIQEPPSTQIEKLKVEQLKVKLPKRKSD